MPEIISANTILVFYNTFNTVLTRTKFLHCHFVLHYCYQLFLTENYILSGTLCTDEIDECLPGPCKHGATCRDQINGFICNCVKSGQYLYSSSSSSYSSSSSSPFFLILLLLLQFNNLTIKLYKEHY